MKNGDLVRFDYPASLTDGSSEELFGVIVSDSDVVDKNGTKFKEVWWMDKDRVSPIKVEYLEVLSETRRFSNDEKEPRVSYS